MATAAFTVTGPKRPQTQYRQGNRDILPAQCQREAAASEQPWTATRCHRHLRPLLSHLAALRREMAKSESKRKSEANRQSESTRKRPNSGGDLPDRKRVRYTYSLKGTKRQRRLRLGPEVGATNSDSHAAKRLEFLKHAPLKPKSGRYMSPGEVAVATPLLSRARKQRQTQSLPSSPIMSTQFIDPKAPLIAEADQYRVRRPPSGCLYRGYYQDLRRAGNGGGNSSKYPMSDEWLELRRSTPPECFQLYQSVFRAVEALLRATSSALETTGKPNSLLAMCLRKIPHYLTACEEEELKEAEENGTIPSSSLPTISFQIYSDLEALGYGTTGWRHLRIAVRAHGVNIVKNACSEGLLNKAFVQLLIKLFIHMRAYPEAEELLAALIDYEASALDKVCNHYAKPDDVGSTFLQIRGPLTSLHLLVQYMNETSRTSFPLRMLGELLSSGHLPVSWLSTEAFSSIWHRIIKLLSSRSVSTYDEDALLDFMAAAVACLVQSNAADDLHDPRRYPSHAADDNNIANSSVFPLSSASSYHTLVSVISNITAILILQQESTFQELCGERVIVSPALQRVSVIVQRSLAEVHTTKPRWKRQKPEGSTYTANAHVATRQFVLALSLFFLHSGPTADSTESSTKTENDGQPGRETRGDDYLSLCTEIIADAGRDQRGFVYGAAVTFITLVAECCGRGAASVSIADKQTARSYLMQFCSSMANHLSSFFAFGTREAFLRRMQADGAFLLASRNDDLRDLAFAESLAKAQQLPEPINLRSKTASEAVALTPAAPPPTALFSGYRWEEGISEWVIANDEPAPNNTRRVSRGSRGSNLGGCQGAVEEATTKYRFSTRNSIPVPRLPLPVPLPSLSLPSQARLFPGSIFRSDRKKGHGHAASSVQKPQRRLSFTTPASNAHIRPLGSDPTPSPDLESPPRESRRLRHTISRRLGGSTQGQTARTLLNLVSDDEEEERAEASEEEADWGDKEHRGSARIRSPLFSLTGNAIRSPGVGPAQQKRASTSSRSHRKPGDATSDDELCL